MEKLITLGNYIPAGGNYLINTIEIRPSKHTMVDKIIITELQVRSKESLQIEVDQGIKRVAPGLEKPFQGLRAERGIDDAPSTSGLGASVRRQT